MYLDNHMEAFNNLLDRIQNFKITYLLNFKTILNSLIWILFKTLIR